MRGRTASSGRNVGVVPKILENYALKKPTFIFEWRKSAIFILLFFVVFLNSPCMVSTVTFNNITMHSVPVMISTVTQAHTVSEGVGSEQATWICRCILCMQV